MKKHVIDVFMIVGMIVSLILWLNMPSIVPVHWNFNGVVDRYGSKMELLFILVMPLISYYGMMMLKKVDPKQEEIALRARVYHVTCIMVSLFLFALSWYICLMIYVPSLNLANGIVIIICVMMIAIGNMMPKLPQNYFIGVKTPWTLSSEVVWKKTHRLSGYLFVALGVVTIILLLLIKSISLIVFIVGLIGIVILVTVYSYLEYKKIKE